MALRMWASSTANALRVSTASRTNFPPAFSLTRCFSTVLEGLKYASSHEWVRHEGSVATVGITDHAQDHLGEVVFVDLPETGTSVSSGSSFGAVESVKATSDINSPISGEIVEVNTKLTETPGLPCQCVSDPPKVVHFGGSDMSEATFLESPTNIGRKMKCHIPCDFSPSANKVNSSPYEDGWMIKVKQSSPSELESLMGAKEYTKFCEEEESH